MGSDRGIAESPRPYDYLLKFLVVGDSDVGKGEILGCLSEGAVDQPFSFTNSGINYKTTTILLDGKRIKLQLWEASGQGRFCTIYRSYSRGAQGILLVYDITNKWSFEGINRWLKQIDEHAPGVPRILIGNRLHLAFNRRVTEEEADHFARRYDIPLFEVSSLCDFNIVESLAALSRQALQHNGLQYKQSWGQDRVFSLQELSCHKIVSQTTLYGIDLLPVPSVLKSYLREYAQTHKTEVAAKVKSSLSLRESRLGRRYKLQHQNDLTPSKSSRYRDRKTCAVS